MPFARDLVERGEEIAAIVDQFLVKFAGIWEWDTRSGPLVLVTATPFGWADLPPEGIPFQRALLRRFDSWADLVNAVLLAGPKQASRDTAANLQDLRSCIDQSGATFLESIDDARSHVSRQFKEVLTYLESLQTIGGHTVLVPDTNALLWRPELDDWSFPDLEPFEVLLLPTVLGELDRLKVLYRNPDVREKAEGLIRRIKGYRNRGRLTDGVALRRGRSTVRAEAREVRELPLPWLDPSVEDDRILGAVLHHMIQEPGRRTVIISRDINLQNKAEFATVPFREPPEADPGGP